LPPSLLGQYERLVAARATDLNVLGAGQDGGAVTALLAYCMDEGLIDGVIATGDAGKPSSRVVRSKDELLDTAGSKYSAIPVLSALKDAEEITNAAVVGLPCHVYGIWKTQFFPGLMAHGYEVGESGERIKVPNIAYVIGLFCTENFNYEKLARFMQEKGVDIGKVRKATYVDPDKCTACELCLAKCPSKVLDEYNAEMSKRKAIYLRSLRQCQGS